MTNVDRVIDSLLTGEPIDPHSLGRSAYRLGEGEYQIDYHGDKVYVVSVREVARMVLPLERPVKLTQIDGVDIELVRVCSANSVEVRLDAGASPAREAALEIYRAAYRDWAERAERGESPPAWPGERLTTISIAVSDDVGTQYRPAWGGSGGEGMEWCFEMAFLPPPPPNARRLTLTFVTTDGESVITHVALPGAQPVQPSDNTG